MNPITLAIPHFNRYGFLLECVNKVITDPRISEIVISDDRSTDGSFEKLKAWARSFPKVRLALNNVHVDCYRNKNQAVWRATNKWVILFDDDNVISPAYLDTIFELDPWQEDLLYCPEFAEPHFNYTAFSGAIIDRHNVAKFMERPHFATALNTANYFFHAEGWLDVHDECVNPHTADSIFQAYNWLKAGKRIMIVPGLRYYHRVHAGSHYKQNVHKTGNFAHEVEQKLREMR